MSSAAKITLKKQLEIVIDLQKNGHDIQGIELLQDIITQFSGHSRPYFLLGLSLMNLGKNSEALDFISRAIAVDPLEAEYHTSLGVVLAKLGKAPLAQARWHEAIRLKPEQAEAHFHLGDALIDAGDPEEAIKYLTKAVEIKTDFIEAWNNLGLCHKALKQLSNAKECFKRAVELNRGHTDSHINLAMTLLIMGNYTDGWQEYEWRFKYATSPMAFNPPDGVPLWRGESLNKKNLLIISEQGFGDTVQFARFLAILKKQCARLTIITPKLLAPLLRENPEIDHIAKSNENLGQIDFYCPLLTIPHILKTTLDTIPQKIPYLSANAKLIQQWQKKLPPAPLRVGLVWEGKPLFQNDPLRRRSVTLTDLAPLAQREDVLFFSLQKGEPAQQLKNPPEKMRIVDLDQEINNFADTAAIIANLDLVISIDTATAHLGGALGKPTWILLPFSPDWRWGLEQETSTWYPNSVLFRQQQLNHWQTPINQMAQRLKKWSRQ
jgi:hypothetical protein